METINGKAIYQPSGKAAEYAGYACNFYVGCSCGCTYCYNKTGRFKKTLGGDAPTLKKCFQNEEHALEIFEKELPANLAELQKHGLFFTFTSDPLLRDIGAMTLAAVYLCGKNNVPVKILTKTTTYIEQFLCNIIDIDWSKIAFGFTLTGHDYLEPGASTNAERNKAMKRLYVAGFKTFASVEPIIDIYSSMHVMEESAGFCHLYKVGLEKGKKYDKLDLNNFISWCLNARALPAPLKYYFKDSLLKAAGVSRLGLPDNCVTKDYNIFNDK
jgi:DNA repair photolyase